MGNTQQEGIPHSTGPSRGTDIIFKGKLKNKLKKIEETWTEEEKNSNNMKLSGKAKQIALSGCNEWNGVQVVRAPTWEWMRLNNKVFSVGCRSCTEYRNGCYFCSRATVCVLGLDSFYYLC